MTFVLFAIYFLERIEMEMSFSFMFTSDRTNLVAQNASIIAFTQTRVLLLGIDLKRAAFLCLHVNIISHFMNLLFLLKIN